MSRLVKQPFLVCYDYDMGGLWAVIDARSENEILDRYPELTIAHERPKWMSDDEFHRILGSERHDIDGEPFGVLGVILADRCHE